MWLQTEMTNCNWNTPCILGLFSKRSSFFATASTSVSSFRSSHSCLTVSVSTATCHAFATSELTETTFKTLVKSHFFRQTFDIS